MPGEGGSSTELDEQSQPLLVTDDRSQLIYDEVDIVERHKLEAALVTKVDRRMSILVLIYILNYIDRNNAAAARLRGFQRDLDMTDTQFATVLSVLYIGYTIMQIPSNMFLNHVGRPSIYLPICMIIWGGISVCTGFTTSYYGALCARFLLGFVEAAFFPGALFLLSKWYKRSELSQRMALLSCGSLLSNAFGALIASGILDAMEGVLGYTAWRWLFFVEGGLTILVAFLSIYILPDFPETTTGWLTSAEQALAVQRMVEDAGTSPGTEVRKTGQFHGLSLAVRDSKVWLLTLGLSCFVISLSFNAYFPTLTATLGFNPTVTLLLCSPPWLVATVVSILVSRHSDRTGERTRHIVIPLLFGILGFAIAISTMNLYLRYMSLFLMAQTYSGFICFLAWASSSVSHPASKRAVALALINCVSQSGNILGSYAWPSKWGPTYNTSYSICMFFNMMTIVLCLLFRRHLSWLNSAEETKEVERGNQGGYRYML